MKKHYLWVRAWPWFLPSFPFSEFDGFEDDDLGPALEARARKWDDEHPGGLSAAQQGWAKSPAYGAEGVILTHFNEVAIAAGWAARPEGTVRGFVDPIWPSKRYHFYSTDDSVLADEILETLCRRRSTAFSWHEWGMGDALLRFGKTPADLPQSQLVHIALKLHDLEVALPGAADWVREVADDAAQIERILRPDPGTSRHVEVSSVADEHPSQSGRMISTRPGLLRSVAVSATAPDADRIAAEDLSNERPEGAGSTLARSANLDFRSTPAGLNDTVLAVLNALRKASKENRGLTTKELAEIVSRSEDAAYRAVKSLRSRGCPISNNRNRAGYFLQEPG